MNSPTVSEPAFEAGEGPLAADPIERRGGDAEEADEGSGGLLMACCDGPPLLSRKAFVESLRPPTSQPGTSGGSLMRPGAG